MTTSLVRTSTRDTAAKSRFISIVTPCYNEEGNVAEIYRQTRAAMQTMPGYEYEHLFMDNASLDSTVEILREIAAEDKRVKVIVNTRNFGQIRSPYYGMLQARGAAVVTCAADLQDPPDLIPEFIKKWEEGFKVVIGVKSTSQESWIMYRLRSVYYWLANRLSTDVDLVQHFSGFALYDREVVEKMRETEEQIPYVRGLVCDLGYERAAIEFEQPTRKKGRTSNNFYSLYEYAMLGITSHSKVPLRIASFAGFAMSIVSLLVALGYLIAKLVLWNSLQLGMAPVLIGIYFFGAVQLFFVGMLGEYIGSIHTQVHKRPLVVEKERINFDSAD